jgi:hypothetical protein
MGQDGDDVQMQLPDGRIVNIPASKGEFIPAIHRPYKRRFSHQFLQKFQQKTMMYVINEADLTFSDAPEGWEKICRQHLE